jgi:peptide/nickel transport system substrate-binding protein
LFLALAREYGRAEEAMTATDVRLLGPLEVTLDGRPIRLGATKQRALFTMLALRTNSVVSVRDLVDGLWGETPPASATKLVQHYVSQLRKLLAGGDAEIVTSVRGYELRTRPGGVDVVDFERLADAAARNGDNGDNGDAAREALSLWRGEPLLDVIGEPFAAAEQRRLNEMWLNLSEHEIAAEIEAGRHDEVLARLNDLAERHPLRERLHALRMQALYAAGRQGEALEAFRQARAILIEQIGVEPGPELQRLHAAVLRQDAELGPRPRPRARPPAPPARRRVPRAVLLAAVLALVAGGVAFAVSRITAPESLDGLAEHAVGRIDGTDGDIIAQYLVGTEPGALAVGDGAVWAADVKDGTVSRIEQSRNRIVTIPVGSDPVALAFGEGAAWVAERGDGTVARISPTSNKVTGRIEGMNAPSALAAGYGAVWIASAVDRTVTRVRPDGSKRVIHLGAPPGAIAVGAGAIWATSEETGALFRIEPRTATIARAIRVGNRPVAVAAGGSGVWVVNRQDATVWRIDPATNTVTDTVAVTPDPAAITLADSGAWVATADAKVARIDPRTRRVASTVGLRNPAAALAAGGGHVWVATQSTAARHRGGTLLVGGGQFEYPSLEPGAYQPQAYQVMSLAYDGLLAYRRTGGTTFGPIVADLAVEVPEPSADGRTYVFRLRRGILFSDGTELEPEDVRASLENLIRRHGKFLPDYFAAIAGAPRCARRPSACDLSAGIATDARERTVTLRLTRPDPFLLYKLASPLAYVAPADQPFSLEREPPGTGPYRVDDFSPERGAELSRNPHFESWSQDARPDGRADRIVVRVSNDDDAGARLAAVERGELDVTELADAFGANVPPDEIKTQLARHPERLHATATPSLFYAWMNVHEPPFRDARVRRAVNLSIDRELIADLDGGDPLASPACHFVAPGHPGYAPECAFTRNPRRGVWSGPDVERALALVERSHTAGQAVTVHVPADKARIGRYLTRLLGRLGYRSRLSVRGDYGRYHSFVADSDNRAQIGTDGWAADFPSPADFTTPFICSEYRPGSQESTNLSQHCDARFEGLIKAATNARGADADALWHAAYGRLARSAPAAPLLNRRGAVFVSERVGNYQHHPLFGVLLDQLWVR